MDQHKLMLSVAGVVVALGLGACGSGGDSPAGEPEATSPTDPGMAGGASAQSGTSAAPPATDGTAQAPGATPDGNAAAGARWDREGAADGPVTDGIPPQAVPEGIPPNTDVPPEVVPEGSLPPEGATGAPPPARPTREPT